MEQPTLPQAPAQQAKLNNIVIIIGSFIILLVISSSMYLFMFRSPQNIIVDQSAPSQITSPEISRMKLDFLRSDSLSIITIGAAMSFVPSEAIKLDVGSANYEFQFYGTQLSEQQHSTFTAKVYPYKEFRNSSYLDIKSPAWAAYAYTESDFLLTRSGFVCLTPHYYGPILCADDESGSCLYPSYQGIQCAYVLNPPENTIQKVSTFIRETLAEAGIICAPENCQVTPTGIGLIPIPQFSQSVIYFEELKRLPDAEYISHVRTESQRSIEDFQSAGWQAHVEDITSKERGWNQGTIVSLEIKATNQQFECGHTITISDTWTTTRETKKREMIYCSVHPSAVGESL